MKVKWYLSSFVVFIVIVAILYSFNSNSKLLNKENSKILSYTVDLKTQELAFYWENDTGAIYQDFKSLNEQLQKKNKKLKFAMNGGMFNPDLSPQGLYIEKGKKLSQIDTIRKGYGNFYMQPNGIFHITKDKKPAVCETLKFSEEDVNFATQSGPLLLIEGKLHPRFIKGSKNLNIRNGVGILPNGKIIFAMSKEEINFYDFAMFFKEQGCKNALYLDGYVSRTYLPEQNSIPMDGIFGVIIGEVEDK